MAKRTFTFHVSSRLAASPAAVWALSGSMAGVNRELFPLFRMTYPAARSRIAPGAVPLGERAFRSWVLLFGVIPVDYDDLTFVDLPPAGGFLEVSSMLSQKEWRHRRTLRPTTNGTGCVVSDEVCFTPRFCPSARLYQVIFDLAFRLRHWNLRRIWGSSGK